TTRLDLVNRTVMLRERLPSRSFMRRSETSRSASMRVGSEIIRDSSPATARSEWHYEIARKTNAMDLLATLEKSNGYDQFRPLQREVISDALAGRGVCVLMPAGGGTP